MNFLIERLKPEDRVALAALRSWQRPDWDLGEEIARAAAELWVARPGPDHFPVAYALIWKVSDEAHLLDLATHADWRRRGAARQLLNNLSRRAGARRVLLEVGASNQAALALYDALGFVRLRRRRGYYPDGDDALEMALEPFEAEH